MTADFRDSLKPEYQQAGRYLYTLLASALNGTNPPVLSNQETWQLVYNLAVHNSVSVIAYYGMLAAPEKPNEFLRQIWKKDILFHTGRQIQMDQVREELAARMDDENIDYIFIKGIVIQDYYPEPGMRQMSDNDILYRFRDDQERGQASPSQKKILELMKSLGAKEVSHDGIVDVFLIQPYSLFEMHRDFLGPDQKRYSYYHNLFDRAAVADLQKPHRMSLSLEEHYVLMLAHSEKHFKGGGCGPREILDIRQYLEANSEKMDWELVGQMLEETELTCYEKQMRHLSEVVFNKCSGTEEDWLILDWMMGCGTYGNSENSVRNFISDIQGNGSLLLGKTRYIWNRLFPSSEYLQTHFPFFYRHRSLIGFLLLYRTCRGLLTSRKRLRREWQTLKKV